MNRILKVMAVLAILLSAAVVAPMADADSEQESKTIRISNNYVYYTIFTYEEGMKLNKNDRLYLKEDNPKAQVLLDYVAGKNVDIPLGDDRYETFTEGERFYVFVTDNNMDIDVSVSVTDGESVKELILGFRNPYSGGLLVKAGDNFTFKVLSTKDNYGNTNIFCYLQEGGKYILLGPGFDMIPEGFEHPNVEFGNPYAGTSEKTTEFKFKMFNPTGPESFYVDVEYEGSGFSTPTGSSAIFAVICAVITLAVMLLMFLAGRGPKWSK